MKVPMIGGPHMRGQSDYFADACAEAAAVFERKLQELATEGGDGR